MWNIFKKKSKKQKDYIRESKKLKKFIVEWSKAVNAPYFSSDGLTKLLIESGYRQCGNNEGAKRTIIEESDPLCTTIAGADGFENLASFLIVDLARTIKKSGYRMIYREKTSKDDQGE